MIEQDLRKAIHALHENGMGVREIARRLGAARNTASGSTVYASWNGATELASWRVLASAGTAAPKPIASAPRSGFETAITVPAGYRSFRLQALDAAGRVIGNSAEFAAQS